ncbi:carbon storage regulator [Gimesia benthica]|uniref:Translational regulator CsrA n=1 Tax=Gimesia benthica TaxID=2608982 RepID=A0A6I6ADD9_9PLAN|nr:carbon storage regulator [Gimesia benthica]QGQ24036.1 carbon storage regulator [Gimesia benthica]
MLVLTRKRDEVIQIGEDIVIKILKTGKGAIKIGIEAPGNVRVIRGELLETENSPEHLSAMNSENVNQGLNAQCA